VIAPDDPFRAVHRAHRRAVWARVLGAVVVLAIGVGLVSLADAVPPSPSTVAAASTARVLLEPAPNVSQSPERAAVDELLAPATLPVVPAAATAEAPALPAPPAAPVGPTSWQITIDTVGYQAEIDDCLWVRMNLGVQAPIVGAHNYCGGSIVLDMQVGDQVSLAGTDLDGTYVVTEARDARVGDSARAATEGMASDVILQTCYWGGDGRLRLLGLTAAPST
jgi:hypothetical protein